MAAKKADKKPSINFDGIAKGLKNLEDKNHIKQIGPSMADEYIKMAKYKDKNGVEMYKTQFSEDDAGKLGDNMYNKMVYHAHRRLFNIDEKKYSDLLKFKNAQGVAYADAVVNHYFNLDRSQLKNSLKDMASAGQDIDHSVLEEMLKENVQHHRQVITGQVVKDLSPRDLESVKGQIKAMVDKHKLDPKVWYKPVEKSQDWRQVLGQYVRIASQYYQEAPKKK